MCAYNRVVSESLAVLYNAKRILPADRRFDVSHKRLQGSAGVVFAGAEKPRLKSEIHFTSGGLLR